ncbi:MAG TPA: hypothetical protein PLK96_04910 [Bacteroidales bacterium]|nr:hypothetical protein [Bacteroidales bacterium]
MNILVSISALLTAWAVAAGTAWPFNIPAAFKIALCLSWFSRYMIKSITSRLLPWVLQLEIKQYAVWVLVVNLHARGLIFVEEAADTVVLVGFQVVILQHGCH